MIQTPSGTILAGQASEAWRHPWWLDLEYAERTDHEPEEQAGEWRATVWPGFVNGRDAYVSMAEGWSNDRPAEVVPLTDDPQPYLVLANWRNPVLAGSLTSAGVYAPGEGYPEYFRQLGVKPAEKGGALERGEAAVAFDQAQSREIRAMDIVLKIPRIGTRLEYRVGDPLGEAQSEFIQTVFLNDYALATKGRPMLSATPKHRELEAQSLEAVYGLLLSAGSDQMDALKMATVWIVSPPLAGEDAEPDHTWEPHVQYFAFWNVNHATNIVPAQTGDTRLTLDVPLAGGVAQPVINRVLSFVNDRNAEAEKFLEGAMPRGCIWTP